MSTPIRTPVNLASAAFAADRHAHYAWLREHEPVHRGRVSVLRPWLLSRYDDCVAFLKDDRFVRNRTTATGGGRFPVPMPKGITLLMDSMIQEDGDDHRRLRTLVHQAFTPTRVKALGERIEQITGELLDAMEPGDDLMEAFARPIPVTVIAEMVGVAPDEVPELVRYMDALTEGFSGLKVVKTALFDLPKAVAYTRGLIARKRAAPGDDILTALVEAEEEGDRLSEDELVAMVFLLIVAGHETTVHLITNAVETLLTHPESLDRLKADADLWPPAVEEILRFNGPIEGTKPGYALEPVTLHGVTIPKGGMVLPLLGAANRDPEQFDDPDTFNIDRQPNRHLGFGRGIHYCLGAPLARLEAQIALRDLFARHPDLRLAVPPDALAKAPLPGWNRLAALPVTWGR